MRLFNRKQVFDVKPSQPEQIKSHKDAYKKAVASNVAASKQLNKVLVTNGFTVKIAVAAGAKR